MWRLGWLRTAVQGTHHSIRRPGSARAAHGPARATLTWRPCPPARPLQIVRYYEAAARWPLAAAPSKSRGLGFLLRSHLGSG